MELSVSALNGKKVLVTGGAGFIGSELVHQLVRAQAHVHVVDNLVNGKRENLTQVADRIELHVVDIRDRDALRSLIQGMDVVFHLACLGVRHSIHSPQENHEVNAAATLELLALAREHAVERFVYVSTSEVYGTARTVPMDELHPTYPMTVYGAAKLAGECYARAYYETYNLPVAIIRPFNSYGPRSHHEGDSGEVIPRFLLRGMVGRPLIVFGDGEQTRDFTFVSDTARGILLAGIADAAIGQTMNVGSGFEISINQLAQAIQELTDREVPVQYEAPRPGDVLRLYADTTKAGRLLGYEPQISLGEGLRQLKRWYEDLEVSPEELLLQERVYNWQPPQSTP